MIQYPMVMATCETEVVAETIRMVTAWPFSNAARTGQTDAVRRSLLLVLRLRRKSIFTAAGWCYLSTRRPAW